jgi:3-phenylpropionate/cinnamic acid dioxygenase small subunit
MSLDEVLVSNRQLLEEMLLHYQVTKFLYDEAALLDGLRFEEWGELFSDDARYFMPIRRTRTSRELGKQFTKRGEMAYFDDDKTMIVARTKKLLSGSAWSEDPPSRTRHMVTNIRVVGDDGNEVTVEVAFHIYRTRLKSEEVSWIGSRHDVLRRDGHSFKIASREIYLEQTILLAPNLSTMF